MGHSSDTTIQVQVVKGGFILTVYDGQGSASTEVFSSHGKLIKALRGLIEVKGDEPEPATAE